MSKIKLSDAFTLIPQGTHVLKITGVEQKDEYGKLEVYMQTREGLKHTERFQYLKDNGEINDGAIQALTFFARTAMNDFSLQEIEPTEMIGHFMECDVTHDVVPSNKTPGKTATFARLSEKRPSEGWIESAPAPAPAAKPKYDLSKLLG